MKRCQEYSAFVDVKRISSSSVIWINVFPNATALKAKQAWED